MNSDFSPQHPLPLPLPLPLPGSDSDDNTDEVYDTTACTVPDRSPSLHASTDADDDATRTSKLRSFSSSTDVRKTIATQAIHRGTKSIELKGAFRSFKRHSIVNPSFASAAIPMSSQDASSRHTSEVAAFAHLLEWCEGAERIKQRMKEEDGKTLEDANICLKFLVNLFCPRCLCCTKNVPEPPTLKSPLYDRFTYARHCEANYQVCCCCCQHKSSLNLLNSMFIWYNLPLSIVAARLKMIVQTFAQLATSAAQWLFLYQILIGGIEYNRQKETDKNFNDVNIPPTVIILSLVTFVLPEIIHIVYITTAPGYNISRQGMQILYTCFAQFGVRPLYELAWSMKWR